MSDTSRKGKFSGLGRTLPIDQANERIERLRRGEVIAPRSTPEDLDGPIEPNLQVTPHKRGHLLELVIGHEPVSWFSVVDFRQNVGRCVLRMGGIAGVRTHDAHRFRGYSRRVMEASLCWMRRAGYHTSMLLGIERFYPKFGFAQAFPTTSFTVALRSAEAVGARGLRMAKFRPQKHLAAVLRMYHANNATRTGVTRRDPASWPAFAHGSSWQSGTDVLVATAANGRPVGYVVFDGDPFTATVTEAGFEQLSVLGDLLRAAARRALRARLAEVRLLLPADHPLVDFCKPLGLIGQQIARKDGGAMVRMIHVSEALRAAAETLGPRMAGRGRLNLLTNLDDVGLDWSGGELRVGPPAKGAAAVRLPQWALAQMLYGYRSASGLAASDSLHAPAAAIDLLEQMFPLTPHYHYHADKF